MPLRIILSLLALGLLMAKDYKGSKTHRKAGCKGCCSTAKSDNSHGSGGVKHSTCGECNMTCHQQGCPER